MLPYIGSKPYKGVVTEITRILGQVQQGEPEAAQQLLSQLYTELRKLAAQKMVHEPPGQTLQPTALVHEAWLRLVGSDSPQWQSRGHFFAAAAEAMRRILVENARRKKRLKRGGQLERVPWEEADIASPMPDDELLALDEALGQLGEVDPRAAEVVKLCFFVGLTHDQAAQEMGVSLSTVERTWTFARAWLFRQMQKNQNSPAEKPGEGV
jgi:RNA polymerase sigma factor (TIGR02999 family)